MFYKFFYGVLCYAYKTCGRKSIILLIDDPESDWDDKALEVLDSLFDYKED